MNTGLKRGWIVVLALAVGLGLAFWFLRPGPSTLDEAEQVMARIGGDKPVLLEFQSNY